MYSQFQLPLAKKGLYVHMTHISETCALFVGKVLVEKAFGVIFFVTQYKIWFIASVESKKEQSVSDFDVLCVYNKPPYIFLS